MNVIKIGTKVRRKGSSIIWKVWGEDNYGVSIFDYSSLHKSSRRVTKDNLKKYWEIVKEEVN